MTTLATRRGRMGVRRSVVLLAAVCSVAVACPAALADASSQQMVKKGLAALEAQQFERAYQIFDGAVRVDPGDARAVFYRGLAAARLGHWNLAIQDMQRGLEIQPDLPGGALDLGVAFYEVQQYDSAEQWLNIARRRPEDAASAAQFLALIRYRTGRDGEALELFREAERDPRLGPTARYYGALVLLRQGRVKEAREIFTRLKAEAPETEVGKVAADYLQRVFEKGGLSATGEAERRWSAHVEAGFEYDSNVVLAPDDSDIKDTRLIDDEGDARFRIGFGGGYRVLDGESVVIDLGYDFYQSVHFSIGDFDLQGHRLHGELRTRPGEWFQFGIAGAYEYYLLDFQSYFQQGTGMPWMTIFEGDTMATQVYYRLRGRDYLEEPFEPFLDGFNNAFGARQFFQLGAPSRVLAVRYQLDVEDPTSNDGEEFGYLGHQLDLEVGLPLWGEARGEAGYALRLADYDEESSRGDDRQDTRHRFTLRLLQPLSDHLTADLAYVGTINDSNIDPFTYNRHVLSGKLRYLW